MRRWRRTSSGWKRARCRTISRRTELRMSSRAWTEVATGPSARSVRRWVRRAVLPRLLRAAMVLLLLVVALEAYVNLSAALREDPVCLGACREQPRHDLDWDPSDLLLF